MDVVDHGVGRFQTESVVFFQAEEPTADEQRLQLSIQAQDRGVGQRELSLLLAAQTVRTAGHQHSIARLGPIRHRLGQTGQQHLSGIPWVAAIRLPGRRHFVDAVQHQQCRAVFQMAFQARPVHARILLIRQPQLQGVFQTAQSHRADAAWR